MGETGVVPGLGIILLLILMTSIQLVAGIEGEIYPLNATYEVGTDVEVTCTLDAGSVPPVTAQDIEWYKGENLIPSQTYQMVTNVKSRIILRNASLSDTAMYFCALQGDMPSDFLGTYIQIGYAPKKARDLTCASSNMLDYHCTWVPVETGIETDHTFWYRKYQSGVYIWVTCPNEDPEPNKCTLTRNDHSGSMQYVYVKSVNHLGEVQTDTVYFNPDTETVPNEPTNLRLSAEGPTSLHAEWELPSDWNIYYTYNIHYRVRYKAASQDGGWSNACFPVISPFCSIGGLNSHTIYDVQVSAKLLFNTVWGDWCDSEQARTAESEPNGKVQNLRVEQQFNSSEDSLYLRNVLISWEPLKEAEQRGVILGYNVRVPQPDGCQDNRTRFDTVNVTQAYIEGLERFCEYVVEVQAYNSQGLGPVESMVLGDMTSTPERPTGVAAKTLSHQSILVSWDEPTVVQGYITAYTVYWTKATDQDLEYQREVSPNDHSVIIDELKGYVLYYFRVSVTNSKGESSRSSQVQNKTAEWVPDAAPTNLTVMAVPGTNNLELDWIEVPGEEAHGVIIGHTAYYCLLVDLSESGDVPGWSDSWNSTNCTEPVQKQRFGLHEATPVRLTGVKPFSQYLVWVSANTSVGEGPRSDHPSVGTSSQRGPSQPVDVRVTTVFSTSIGIAWSAPQIKNGIIQYYKVFLEGDVASDKHEYMAGENLSYTVEGLYGHENYSLQVQAWTTEGGELSDRVVQVTDIGVPEQPESLTVSGTGYDAVRLNWESPSHPNGPITYYQVSHRMQALETSTQPSVTQYWMSMLVGTQSGDDIDEWKTVNVSGTSTELTLDCSQAGEQGTNFNFQVLAVNIHNGKTLLGAPASTHYKACEPIPTNLGPFLWLILPGVILLLILAMCLYQVQAKLGKSWPEPAYKDIVKNRYVSSHPLWMGREPEKETFDVIPGNCRLQNPEVATVAEDFQDFSRGPTLTIHMVTSSDAELGSKDILTRTLSIDSGVPPSPNDNELASLSGDEVFPMQCTVTKDHHELCAPRDAGSKRGHHGRRLASSSSSCEGVTLLPPIAEKGLLGSEDTKAIVQGLYDDDDNDGFDACMSTSGIDSIKNDRRKERLPNISDTLQSSFQYPHKGIGSGKQGFTMADDFNEELDDRLIMVSPKLAAVGNFETSEMAYSVLGASMSPGLAKTGPALVGVALDNGYVSGSMAYAEVATRCDASHQSTPTQESSSLGYVSEDSLVYTKLSILKARQAEDNLPKGDAAETKNLAPSSPFIPASLTTESLPSIANLSKGLRATDLHKNSSADPEGEETYEQQPLSRPSIPPLVLESNAREISDYVSGQDLLFSLPSSPVSPQGFSQDFSESISSYVRAGCAVPCSKTPMPFPMPVPWCTEGNINAGTDNLQDANPDESPESPVPSLSILPSLESLVYKEGTLVEDCGPSLGDMVKDKPKEDVDEMKRTRNESIVSSSSSSGYISESGLISREMTKTGADSEECLHYANLAFSDDSETETEGEATMCEDRLSEEGTGSVGKETLEDKTGGTPSEMATETGGDNSIQDLHTDKLGADLQMKEGDREITSSQVAGSSRLDEGKLRVQGSDSSVGKTVTLQQGYVQWRGHDKLGGKHSLEHSAAGTGADYQVPTKSNLTDFSLSADYVPYCPDNGYSSNTSSNSEVEMRYLPMSPIHKNMVDSETAL
ncbi:uncharacterized protein [Diadema antillarum]|uniref:uncharacterized protein n=1 Tax=Diadema antillarum TaxID=105358 RepID=UPI003A86D3C4